MHLKSKLCVFFELPVSDAVNVVLNGYKANDIWSKSFKNEKAIFPLFFSSMTQTIKHHPSSSTPIALAVFLAYALIEQQSGIYLTA